MDLRTVRIISTAVFICVGTAGNILSVITVSNKHCKKSSYTVFLTGLAIADLLALYTITTVIHAQQETFGINPIATNSLSCKLHLFVANLFSGVSIWLIVALALERAFSVYCPFKVKSVCKPKTALIIMAMIVAFFIAFNAHFVYGMQLQYGVSPNGDTLKPSLNTNASTNYGENENHAAILPPFEESVSGCFNNNNDDDDDDDDDDDNSSIIDEISGPKVM